MPPTSQLPQDLGAQHDMAWRWLQAGDTREASRAYQAVLKRMPGFVPSTTGLGYVALAERNYALAEGRFAAAVHGDDRYLPAWVGRSDTAVAMGDDVAAITALERILQLDPGREGVAARLDLVRFRRVQTLIDTARTARTEGKLADAQRALNDAVGLSPASSVILGELVAVEQAAGDLERAEAHARQLVDLDAGTAAHLALLAGVLEARGKVAEAAAYYGRAVAIEPRDAWRAKAATLRDRAALDALPAALRGLPSAASVTRGDVAAYVGATLADLIAKAPSRPVQVATDVRGHWAAAWIAPVTRAGVMRLFENHTFQPASIVRRGGLAEVAAALVELAAAGRPADLARWRAARPRFVDLPPTHVFYRPAALAVAAGVLTADSAGRFQPTDPVAGADLVAVVTRITQLTQRR